MQEKIVAYCIVPRIGGTFNFYKNLRVALKPYGWKVLGVASGQWECSHWQEEFADDGCIRIAEGVDEPVEVSQELVKWVEKNKVDIFIPMSSQIAASSVPHLPSDVSVVNRCNNITRYTYDIVCNNSDYISRIIATSKRQYDDLLYKRKVPKDKLAFIPHGLPIDTFNKAYGERLVTTGKIRLGYLGRLSHHDKGCLHLIELVKKLKLADIQFTLDIIGSGVDESELKHRMKCFVEGGHVRFLGRQPNHVIPNLLKDIDVFVMPSYFEGFGFSLVEAMAAGCVPIASKISGVTDWIIKHNHTGFVIAKGDMGEMVQYIVMLNKDRDLLKKTSSYAAQESSQRFNLEIMGENYDRVFRQLLEQKCIPKSRDWSEFTLDKAYQPTWRRFVPQNIKNWVRRLSA